MVKMVYVLNIQQNYCEGVLSVVSKSTSIQYLFFPMIIPFEGSVNNVATGCSHGYGTFVWNAQAFPGQGLFSELCILRSSTHWFVFCPLHQGHFL